MKDIPCFLSDHLYVPEEYVDTEILRNFEYEIIPIGATEPEYYHTYIYERKNDIGFYGFCRGDMRKLLRLFGHLRWVDRRVIYPLGVPLRMRLKLYKEQKEVLYKWLRFPYRSIEAQTGWGKTTAMIGLMSLVGLRTLVLTHTRPIRDEWVKRIKAETNIQELELLHGQRLLGNINEKKLFPVTVATYQTFSRGKDTSLIEKAKKETSLLLVDEGHRESADGYAGGVVTQLNPYLIVGCTATPEREDGKEFIFNDTLGPFTIVGKGTQPICDVHFVYTKFAIRNTSYNYVVNGIARSKERNNLIVDNVVRDVELENRKVLVVTIRVKHAQLLTSLLRLKGMRVDLCTGTYGDKFKSAERMNAGELDVIVATIVFDEGVNMDNLDCVHLTIPTGNAVRTEQRSGRSRRKHESKKERNPKIVDYVDADNPKINRWLWKRITRYKKLGFRLFGLRGKIERKYGETPKVSESGFSKAALKHWG